MLRQPAVSVRAATDFVATAGRRIVGYEIRVQRGFRRPGHRVPGRRFARRRSGPDVAVDQRLARSSRRAARSRAAPAPSARRRPAPRRPAAPGPGTVTITGTGLSECAVFGLPSGSSMWSALPWSAVMRQAPPVSCTAATTSPRQRSTVSIASTAAGITPVWPTMSALAKLMIPNAAAPPARRRRTPRRPRARSSPACGRRSGRRAARAPARAARPRTAASSPPLKK